VEKDYQLSPYVIVIYSHSLYVIGDSDGRVRTFKVDRVSEVELLDEHFDLPENFEASGFLERSFGVWQRGEKPFTVRVRFTAEAAKYVAEKRWFQHQTLEEQSDGSVILSAEISDSTAIRGWLCSFRGAAQVLEPQALIDEMIADSEAIRFVHVHPALGRNQTAKPDRC
jgi:predicted DNA-binding transcriptional regulator YafY